MFDTVAVAGVGLIGGSLGLALRSRGLARRVVGLVRRQATVEAAIALGALDAGSTDPSIVRGAELIVLAPPVLTMPAIAAEIAPHLTAGSLVTDVGSTKSRLVRELPLILPPAVAFVGGHPMAGSEKGGVEAARADLFEGAVYVLTPVAETDAPSLARMAGLVRALGAVPVEMEPALHDEAVARISHLPHVAAAVVAEAAIAGTLPLDILRLLVAGGFKTTTRIAASPPEMWRDICLTNREAMLDVLSQAAARLDSFREALQGADGPALLAAFERGKHARDLLVPPNSPSPDPR